MQDALFSIGDWQLDTHSNSISDSCQVRRLEHKQVQLLLYLMAHAGRITPKRELLHEVWEGRVVVDDVVSVAVSQLRKALNDNARSPKFIKTIPGAGYQFICPLTSHDITRARQFFRSAEGNESSLEVVSHRNPSAGRLATDLSRIVLISIVVAVASTATIAWVNKNDRHTSLSSSRPPIANALMEQYEQARELRLTFQGANIQQSAKLLHDVIRQAPEFADAYVLLARAKRDLVYHDPLVEYSASEELAALLEKAIELDPTSSAAHELFGNILFFVDRNHEQARKHLEKALELDPNNATAHHVYGLFLLAHGEFDQSHKHIVTARKLDPLYYSVASVAWVLAMQGRHEEAWQETKKLLSYRPDELQYHRSALRLFEASGDEKKAYHHLRKILELAKYSSEELITLDTTFAQDRLAGVYSWLAYTRADSRDIGFYPPPLSFARFAIAAGQYDDAFIWLREAQQHRQRQLLWLAVDPKYDPIREDPRFKMLLKEVGLSQ